MLFLGDKPVAESEIASYWWHSSGILVAKSKPPRRTVQNVKANLEVVQQISGGKKPCLLVYLTSSPVPDKATRQYVNSRLPEAYKAMAMVSTSGLGRVIMNFLFAFNTPPIPIKSFSDDNRAIEWLKTYL